MNVPQATPSLQTLPPFHGLNDTELHQLAEVLKVRQFAAGELVLEQGQTSQALWVLLEGRCEVIKYYDHQPEESVLLAELEQNSYFGEMSFFSPAPHSASVRAKTEVKLLQLARCEYDDMIQDGVWAAYKVAYNVMEGMASRLRRMDDWVAKLSADHHASNVNTSSEKKQQAEWMVFRNRLFDGWNL